MANGMLYMSGQIALVPETGEVVDEGIEAQTIRVLKIWKAYCLRQV